MATLIKIQDWLDAQSPDSGKEKRLFLNEDQVRSYPAFKDAPDEEVNNIINSLHQLSLIAYEIVSRELNDTLNLYQNKAA